MSKANIDHLLRKRDVSFPIFDIDIIKASTQELQYISEQLGLALSLEEMRSIQRYFHGKKRACTDVELQALGQSWSEHCCYKSSKVPLKTFIYGIAEDKIIAREDAGVVVFDKDHYYCAALESHNHPSAVEPYGGAATGVGGIVRDIVCMGAQPIAYVDPLFFGPLNFPFKKLPRGVKHPRFLFKGVVDGIRDYGNRIGIPTLSGQVSFHPGYTGNCLVNVGSIGIMRKEELIHSRAKHPGDIYVYVGGRTGRDGIHGVTFASAELSDESEQSSRSAVQVGDPITKEPLIHVTLECNRKKLLEGLKDFGGGGLSCVCGELAYDAGFGAEIHLEQVPLKEPGLSPWEIWVSESQERMMFLVSEKNLEEVLHICKQWDVIAVPIGKVIKEKITRVFYEDEKILEMDMDFFTGGPVYDSCQRPFAKPKKKNGISEKANVIETDPAESLLQLLAHPNIASKDWVIRQYDHEVRGATVIKPLQGCIGGMSHGDATVIKPLEDSYQGLAVTANVNPLMMQYDPYWGACSAVDETCRNLTSVGAVPDALLDCLNFGNPEKPERMGEFYEVCRGLGDMVRVLDLPFMSGNVSFYNESPMSTVPPTPEIMGIGLVPDIRSCVTADLKQAGNPLYLVGRETRDELGGSMYHQISEVNGGLIPQTDPEFLCAAMQVVHEAIMKGFVASCHDCSEGGLAVSLAEMAIGGNIGFNVDLMSMRPQLRFDCKLFSETNTRWILEVHRNQRSSVESLFEKNDISCVLLGYVQDSQLFFEDSYKNGIDLPLDLVRKTWQEPLWTMMG